MKTLNVTQFYNGFHCYFEYTCSNFDKVIKLFILYCLHHHVLRLVASYGSRIKTHCQIGHYNYYLFDFSSKGKPIHPSFECFSSFIHQLIKH